MIKFESLRPGWVVSLAVVGLAVAVALRLHSLSSSAEPGGLFPALRTGGPQPVASAAQPHLVPQVGHYEGIRCLAFSPDGKTLATGSLDATARLWDTASGQLKAILRGHSGAIMVVAFSGDGKTVATGSLDGTAALWSATTGQLRTRLEGHADEVDALAFSPDSRSVATGSRDGTVRVWKTLDGQPLMNLPAGGRVGSIAFSEDGKKLVAGAAVLAPRESEANGDVLFWMKAQLWDASTGKPGASLADPHYPGPLSVLPLSLIAVSHGRLAAGSGDGTVRLYDTRDNSLLHVLRGHTASLLCMAFAPGGAEVATGSRDGTARLWDVATGHVVGVLNVRHPVNAMAFSPDGKVLATRGGDSTVQLWDAASGRALITLTGHVDGMSAVAFSPDNRTLATGSFDRSVRLWNYASGQCTSVLRGDIAKIRSYAYSLDGKLVLTGGEDHVARVWDAARGALQMTLPGHSQRITAAALSSNDALAATASVDGSVRVWQPTSGRLTFVIQGLGGRPDNLAFSPGADTLAVSRFDYVNSTVGFWDLSDHRERLALPLLPGEVSAVAFSPDGRSFATATTSHQVQVWDSIAGALRTTLPVLPVTVDALAFSPDGSGLATSTLSPDGRIRNTRLWDARSGILIRELHGNNDTTAVLAFSSDGAYLASVGRDLTTRLWNLHTGEPAVWDDSVKGLPAPVTRPLSVAGSAAILHSGEDGSEQFSMMPLEVGGVAQLGAAVAPAGAQDNDWIAFRPDGHFDCSSRAGRFFRWNLNGVLFPANRYFTAMNVSSGLGEGAG